MKRMSLRTRLIAVYILLAIVPILTVSLFSYGIYVRDTNSIEGNLMNYSATQVSGNLSGKFSGYKLLLSQIVMDEEIRRNLVLLARNGSFHSNDMAILRKNMSNLFFDYVWPDSSVIGVTLVTHDLETVSFDRVKDSNYYVNRWVSASYRRAILEKGMGANGSRLRIFSPYGLEGAPESAANIICLTFPAADWVRHTDYGLFVLEVDANAVTSVIGVDDDTTLIEGRVSPYSCISDGEGRVIASAAPIVGERADSLTSSGLPITSAVSRPIAGTDLTLHLFFQSNALKNYVDNFGLLVSVITIAITAVFLMVVYKSFRKLAERANTIAAAMGEFEQQHRDIVLDTDRDDEILAVISRRFQQMTRNISHLLTELEKRNEQVAFEADQRRRAEIKALQAQINPHFLYNALDRINWMAIDIDQMEISKMLSGLGKLLRYSTSNVDVLVTLKAEIAWMEQYVYIQGQRFSREINLVVTLGVGADEFPIYKMLLQPLVENAILHGMDESGSPYAIRLDAAIQADGGLQVTLADEGVGMQPERLAYLRDIISRKSGLTADSIGISNVVNRLWLYYGQQYRMSVDSRPGGGTVFEIYVPNKT